MADTKQQLLDWIYEAVLPGIAEKLDHPTPQELEEAKDNTTKHFQVLVSELLEKYKLNTITVTEHKASLWIVTSLCSMLGHQLEKAASATRGNCVSFQTLAELNNMA